MAMTDGLTGWAGVAVRSAALVNRGFLVAVALGLLLSWAFAHAFSRLVGQLLPGANVLEAVAGMRWTMLLGIIMSLATDRLLVALEAMVASAHAGDPFLAVNAERLQRIGWCLLAVQLCEIPADLIARSFPAMGSAAPGGDISIAGWISVLMVFVLARVFAVGAGMREDLQGTV